MDVRKLMDAADAETVAEYMGMQVVHKGRYNYIKCPGHIHRLGKEDTHIGNAVLTRRGYRCYACGEFVPLPQMVMEYMQCSKADAYSIIAKAMGGEFLFDDAADTKQLKFPALRLTEREAAVLGLYPQFQVTVKPTSESDAAITDGLFRLYRENAHLYYKLIYSKSDEAYKTYKEMKAKYADRSASQAYMIQELLGPSFNSSVYGQISRELDDRMEICSRIGSVCVKAILALEKRA